MLLLIPQKRGREKRRAFLVVKGVYQTYPLLASLKKIGTGKEVLFAPTKSLDATHGILTRSYPTHALLLPLPRKTKRPEKIQVF